MKNLLDYKISRRDFLKTGIMAAGVFAIKPWENIFALQNSFPDGQQLGRNCVEGMIHLRAHPSENSAEIAKVYEDTVVVWLREVVGESPQMANSRIWVETPNGYLYAPSIQPVKNLPNKPVSQLPTSSMGPGFWAEVTVPYVDIDAEIKASPWVKNVKNPRLYYSQVMWINGIKTNDQGQVLYRVIEQYGSYGDVYWCAAEAFRPITVEEVAPIHPDATDKKILVDLNYQTLSCYEGKDEVYFCTISSGEKFDANGKPSDKSSTPVGQFHPYDKLVSVRMSGGAIGTGYDTGGIAWTTLFEPKGGAAIHTAFWHNAFGTPRSHGCVNARAEDAKWIFRWGLPNVALDPGRVSINMSGPPSTVIEIVDQSTNS